MTDSMLLPPVWRKNSLPSIKPAFEEPQTFKDYFHNYIQSQPGSPRVLAQNIKMSKMKQNQQINAENERYVQDKKDAQKIQELQIKHREHSKGIEGQLGYHQEVRNLQAERIAAQKALSRELEQQIAQKEQEMKMRAWQKKDMEQRLVRDSLDQFEKERIEREAKKKAAVQSLLLNKQENDAMKSSRYRRQAQEMKMDQFYLNDALHRAQEEERRRNDNKAQQVRSFSENVRLQVEEQQRAKDPWVFDRYSPSKEYRQERGKSKHGSMIQTIFENNSNKGKGHSYQSLGELYPLNFDQQQTRKPSLLLPLPKSPISPNIHKPQYSSLTSINSNHLALTRNQSTGNTLNPKMSNPPGSRNPSVYAFESAVPYNPITNPISNVQNPYFIKEFVDRNSQKRMSNSGMPWNNI